MSVSGIMYIVSLMYIVSTGHRLNEGYCLTVFVFPYEQSLAKCIRQILFISPLIFLIEKIILMTVPMKKFNRQRKTEVLHAEM